MINPTKKNLSNKELNFLTALTYVSIPFPKVYKKSRDELMEKIVVYHGDILDKISKMRSEEEQLKTIQYELIKQEEYVFLNYYDNLINLNDSKDYNTTFLDLSEEQIFTKSLKLIMGNERSKNNFKNVTLESLFKISPEKTSLNLNEFLSFTEWNNITYPEGIISLAAIDGPEVLEKLTFLISKKLILNRAATIIILLTKKDLENPEIQEKLGLFNMLTLFQSEFSDNEFVFIGQSISHPNDTNTEKTKKQISFLLGNSKSKKRFVSFEKKSFAISFINFKEKIDNFKHIHNVNLNYVDTNSKLWSKLKEKTQLQEKPIQTIIVPKELKQGEISLLMASGHINGEMTYDNKGNGEHFVLGHIEVIETNEEEERYDKFGNSYLTQVATKSSKAVLNLCINKDGRKIIKSLS